MPITFIIFGVILLIGFPILYLLYKKSQKSKYNYGFMGKKLAVIILIAMFSVFSITTVSILNKNATDNRTNASKVWSSDINYSIYNEKLNVTAILFEDNQVLFQGYEVKFSIFDKDTLLNQKVVNVSELNTVSFENFTNATKLVVEIYKDGNLVKSFEKEIN